MNLMGDMALKYGFETIRDILGNAMAIRNRPPRFHAMTKKMKTGILITARVGSTRLKHKHLRKVKGKPIIFFLLERIIAEFSKECQKGEGDVVICSSDLPENTDFEILAGNNTKIFYGPNSNIPLRHLLCAEKNGFTHILSIDGDDILCSTHGMRKVHEALCQGKDYVRTTGLPLGMNSCGYSKEFLSSSLENRGEKVLEIDWGRIFDESALHVISIPFPYHNDLLRLTLDYQLDYELFKLIIDHFKDSIFTASDIDLAKFVLDNGLFSITEPIAEEYWHNYYKLKEEERDKCKG